jgi:hypothetical protein
MIEALALSKLSGTDELVSRQWMSEEMKGGASWLSWPFRGRTRVPDGTKQSDGFPVGIVPESFSINFRKPENVLNGVVSGVG